MIKILSKTNLYLVGLGMIDRLGPKSEEFNTRFSFDKLTGCPFGPGSKKESD
jgi:hypothetical protein